MAQGEDIIPIPGTTKIANLEENLGALKVEIGAEDDRAIRDAVEGVEITGTRYPAAFMKGLFADTPEKRA